MVVPDILNGETETLVDIDKKLTLIKSEGFLFYLYYIYLIWKTNYLMKRLIK